jgi:hypothetical protein
MAGILKTELEHILTNFNKASMISYIDAHPENFTELIELALLDKQPCSWRAAWLLWSCMEKNDQRLKDYLHPLILSIPERKDDQQRELLIILQKMKLTEDAEGLLFDICVSIWETIHKKPSVRMNALKLILKISKPYPELLKEISYLIEEQYLDGLSSCARKAITKMMR